MNNKHLPKRVEVLKNRTTQDFGEEIQNDNRSFRKEIMLWKKNKQTEILEMK